MSPKPREGVDFFPLNVEYEEKLYAAGRIPGSFMRREGRPGEMCIRDRRLGGGGHTRAAGCELLGNLDNAKSAILAEVEAELDRPETQEES